MKYVYLNDTKKDQAIHGASSVPSNKTYLKPAESIIVEISEGTAPYIKCWDDVVLLSYIDLSVLSELEKNHDEK